MCHLSELGDAVKFLFVKKKTKRKKKFLLYFAIYRRNEGAVTYGIRAGSTRDLGFTTGSVDMIMLIILSLIELMVVCTVIIVE
jgi:hypothetical protein